MTEPPSPLRMLLSRHTKRREFISLLGGAAATWPLAARAQQPTGKLPRIGSIQNFQNENFEAFIQGLREAGYVDGQNMLLETRFYGGALDRIDEFARDLVALKCSVILATGPYAIRAVMNATSTIPIVGIDLESDPVGNGWVKSLARPGGNFTGFFLDIPELGGKQVELLKEAVPTVTRLAVLWDATVGTVQFHATETAARPSGVTLESFPIRSAEDIKDGIERAAHQQLHGLVVLTSPLIFNQRSQIADLALKARLPTISVFNSFPKVGGFMAYGPNLASMFKRAGTYIDRILSGANPGELPVERPTKFELVINLKTARALGFDVPWFLQQRADELIE
jgi:putative tryptophan/tyrosine transport system substrate-binding protein